MIKKIACMVILAVMASFSVVATQSPASADVPQLIYRCTLPHVSNDVFTVSGPEECRSGFLWVTNTHNGNVDRVDMWMIEARIEGGSSLAEIEQACRSNIVCDIAYAFIVTRVLGRIYRWLKAIVG